MQDLAIVSSVYLGNIQYFQILANAKHIIIDQHENYTKQSYKNRCSIFGTNKVLDLIVPTVKNSGQKTPMHETQISYDTLWHKIHWQSIISSYNSSPYFEYYRDEFEPIFKNKHPLLLDFNNELLNICCNILQIDNKIELSGKYISPEEINPKCDFRTTISPKIILPENKFKKYHQVFGDKLGFKHNLSIIDLIFNEGPEAINYLTE